MHWPMESTTIHCIAFSYSPSCSSQQGRESPTYSAYGPEFAAPDEEQKNVVPPAVPPFTFVYNGDITSKPAPTVQNSNSQQQQQQRFWSNAERVPQQNADRLLQSTEYIYPDFNDTLHHIETITQWTFGNHDLLREALYAGRPTFIGNRYVLDENTRLALIGDAVLKLAWWDEWVWGAETGGSADYRFRKIASNEALGRMGLRHGLDVSVSQNSDRYVAGQKRMANAMEAIIGAVWYDSGKDLEAIKHILYHMIGKDIY